MKNKENNKYKFKIDAIAEQWANLVLTQIFYTNRKNQLILNNHKKEYKNA